MQALATSQKYSYENPNKLPSNTLKICLKKNIKMSRSEISKNAITVLC